MSTILPAEREALSPFTPAMRGAAARHTRAREAEVDHLLSTVRSRLASFHVTAAMELLCTSLTALRRTLSPEGWRETVAQCRAGDLMELVQHAPIARRAYARPRGYPGDAETLDLIYGRTELASPLTPLAAMLYGNEMQMSAAQSVRTRRELLAALIDEVALEQPLPRILSVACGHLREAELSAALSAGEVAGFDALDQDRDSLALVGREHGSRGVRPVEGSVRSILRGETRLERYDLVYSAGLYDYLDTDVAARLTAALFAAVRPGGRLLVANFAHGVREAAYMEAFMNWPLIYRDEREVAAFTSRIPEGEIAAQRLFSDEPRNVIYLELRRG